MESELSTTPLMLINLLFAVIAFGTGFIAGGWFLGGKLAKQAVDSEPDEEAPTEQQLAVERAAMATIRLRDLAASVATDVGEHSHAMEQVSADLQAAKDQGQKLDANELGGALTQILTANERLQDRLATAERQIQAQAEEIRAHEAEARTDSLTQLANRRAFDDQLQQRFAEWQRNNTPFSLVILDVDHFKQFNDTHGHQAGDEVLRRVARAIEGGVRDMDIACRYGGEEFAVILPSTTAEKAFPQIERLRSSIESAAIEFEGKTLSVTASLGLAGVAVDEGSAQLLRRADDALYAAKDAGRNNGHWHDGAVTRPVAAANGEAAGEAEQLEEPPVSTATLDSLPNRTLFAEELRRRISESERTGLPLSILLLNIVGLEEISAQYGQPTALTALDSLALFLRSTLRDMDMLARMGDEQFAVLLPTAVDEDARIVANRTAKALAGCALPVGDQQIHLQTAVSVAQLGADDTAATLLGRAEELLTAGVGA